MRFPRLDGLHHHFFNHLADIDASSANEGDVLTLDGDLKPTFGSPSSGPHEIISATHTDTDTGDTPNDGDVLTFDTADSKWHPAAPTGGSGITAVRTYLSFGCNPAGQDFTP